MNKYFRVLSTVALAVTASVVTCSASQAEDLEAGFRDPPAKARPHAYWPWMNGNITSEGITADLEAMARVGMGGGQIFNIAGASGCDIPAGPIDYFSAEWLDLVKHSASEAKRLGLKICLHNCAGWATSGGPWIKPENASQIVVSTEIKVAGGKRITGKLPLPEIRENYYRDIAVFAFPTPKDDKSRMSRWTTGALYRACRTGRQPSLQPASADAAIAPKTILDISRQMGADGTLVWDAPPGSWTILRLGYTPTGNTNQPSPDSGRGLEIDKLSPEGLDIHWREGVQPVLDHLGPLVGKGLNNILIDSYEGGSANWTPRLREEFRKRRGYDPSGYLIALTGRIVGDGPTTSRFLWDFRRTVADLYADYYYGHFAKKCRDRGLTFSTEPYRGPFESLKVASHADIPMGEFWTNQIYAGSLKLASSAGHITGRDLIGAEAFTAGPGQGRWKTHPGSLRRIGDLAWTRGINRFIFHRFTHQPWLDKFPGMTMGQYGSHIDRTNTWWEPGRAWMKYIARSQFLLQQGDFVGDVLCFVGEASPVVGASHNDIKAAGYDYDLCGTDVMAALKVANGDVVVPSGKRYRLLLLPNTPFQTPALARKVRDLVRAGAAVLGPKPKYTPSLADLPASEKEVRSIAEEVWGKCDGAAAKANRFGKGRIFAGIAPAEVLAQLNVAPDVKLPDGLAWIHRRTAKVDIFLISNQSDKAAETLASFRVGPKQPELWDAEKGAIRQAAGWTISGQHARVPISLLPGKSIFVVFRHPGKPQPDPYVKVEATRRESSSWPDELDGDQGCRLRAYNNGPRTLVRASGKTHKIEVTGLPNPLKLDGPWDVRFQAKRGAPKQARFDRLMSWSEHKDPGIRYFSGTATSSTRFEVSKDFLQPGREVYLDLGDVAVIAEVRLNKKNLGILWHGPFRIEVSKALRVGTNTLEVEVTNLWVNRLIGDEHQPADCEWTESHLTGWPDWLTTGKPRPVPARITFTTWKHWSANDPLLCSGLIGPVSLRCASLVPLSTKPTPEDSQAKPELTLEAQCAAPFCDNAIFQQAMPLPVWGTSLPGAKITVTFDTQTTKTVARADGTWRVTLDAMQADKLTSVNEAPEGRTLTIVSELDGKQATKTARNILIGEVWLCSGQSNMAGRFGRAPYPKGSLAEANYPALRSVEAREWKISTPQTAGRFSRVAFCFARKLQSETMVPIGLLTAATGGSPIESWMRVIPQDLQSPQRPRPAGQARRLTNYETKIAHLVGYRIRGALWYQGEGNAKDGREYFLKMQSMIGDWRKSWGQGDFPFYFVQLASIGKSSKDTPVGGDGRAKIRNAQLEALTLKNTGMAVAIDIGALHEHPINKYDVGIRLARWALHNEYGQKTLVPSGPIYKSCKVEGNTIRVSFDYANNGLMLASKDGYLPPKPTPGAAIPWLSIQAKDGRWHWAEGKLDGSDLIVWCKSVSHPVAVRYAYTQHPAGCNLYNKDGLPASPFSTCGY